MQKCYKTRDERFYVNENHVSMFRIVKENSQLYEIEMLTDFNHNEPYILCAGEKDEVEDTLSRLERMLSYEDWIHTKEGLIRIDHVRTVEMLMDVDGVFTINLIFSENNKLTVFNGSEAGAKNYLDNMKKHFYSIIYDINYL